MIRFILLLPIKLLGLVFLGIGGAIEASQRRAAEAERVRVAQAKQDERERLRREREATRATRAAQTEAARIRREQERAKAEQLRAAKAAERVRAAQARAEATASRRIEAERIRAAKAAERVREADNDLAHLEQRQRDLSTLYSFAEAQYNNAGTDRQKEAAYRKMMALDQQRRTAARQAERLQYTISTGGR